MAAGAQALARKPQQPRPYRPMASVAPGGAPPQDPTEQRLDEQYMGSPTTQAGDRQTKFDIDPKGGMPDTSGYDPYGEGAGSTPISTLQSSSVPFYSGDDIAKQFPNNRNTERNTGDRYEGLFNEGASRRAGLENAALLKSQQLQGQLEQTPGYTQSESDAIMGNTPDGGNAYRDLLNTDYQSNYLTPEEQAGMKGDPYGASKAFDPSILNNTNETGFNASTGYIEGTKNKLDQSFDVQKDAMGNAVDPSKLGLSRGYQSGSDAVLNATGDRVWDAANSEGLDMSGEYGRQAGMTDQEVSDTAAMGGQAVGARGRSAIQDLERDAAASGNSSPLAIAAARRQLEDQTAVGSADATVNAQLAARDAQRRAATGVEGTRLSSEQYKTGAQIGAGMDLGRFAQGTLDTREGMRLGTEQDISNRQLGVASQLGQVGRSNAQYTGDRQLQNEADWTGRASDAGKFNQTAAYTSARDADAAASGRAGAVAENRQGTNQANQGNQFNRGYQVNATLSGAAQGIGDARRQGQQENRGYYQGQQQYQGAQQNQQQQNMLTNRSQTQQGVNQATQGSAAWELGNKNAPNWYTKNVLPTINAAANVARSAPQKGGG